MHNPINSLVIKLHSTYTSLFLISCWVFVTCNYYTSDIILCVSKFDRSVISNELEHICLTYSFTVSSIQETRYYVLHYKWIHWMFIVLALIYKLPGFILDTVFSPTHLLDALSNLSSLPVDYNISSRSLSRSIWYWARNYGRHDRIFRNKVIVHVLSLFANIFAFFLVDLLLQGNYYLKLLFHWPFVRDYHKFRDPLSSLFPPFTLCETSPRMQLWMGRTERVGCHLPLMEVYEKVFLVLWLWQGILAVTTTLYIIFALFCSKKLNVLCSGGQENTLLIHKFWNVSTGELYALGCFKKYLTKAQMRCLLYTIARDFFHIQ